jgi:hypothetical protein
VVLEELREQLAEMIATPQFTAEGVSISYGGNMQALREMVNKFVSEGGTGLDETPLAGVVSVGRLRRASYR